MSLLEKNREKNYFLGWSSRNAKRLKKNKPDVRPADEEYRFLVYGKGMTEKECAQKIFSYSCPDSWKIMISYIQICSRFLDNPLDTVTGYFFHLIHLILLFSDLDIIILFEGSASPMSVRGQFYLKSFDNPCPNVVMMNFNS